MNVAQHNVVRVTHRTKDFGFFKVEELTLYCKDPFTRKEEAHSIELFHKLDELPFEQLLREVVEEQVSHDPA